jgi:arabinose-5-phosphate isomerase
MARQPVTVGPGAMLADAIEILSRNRISELPVVDEAGRPVGIIDITDVVGIVPFARAQTDAVPLASSAN